MELISWCHGRWEKFDKTKISTVIFIKQTTIWTFLTEGWSAYNPYPMSLCFSVTKKLRNNWNLAQIAKFMGSTWGPHLGPVGPRWAPWWPHEPCFQGDFVHVTAPQLPFFLLNWLPVPCDWTGYRCDFHLIIFKSIAKPCQVHHLWN